MIDVSSETSVGYALVDRSLTIVTHNATYAQHARRTDLRGASFEKVFPGAEDFVELMRLVFGTGYVVKTRAYPYTFMHGAKYEERYFDLTLNLLGEPGDDAALLLIRVAEVARAEVDEANSLLRQARSRAVSPLMSGEDMEGRTIDVYVHPSMNTPAGRTAVLAVYRDSSYNITFEFDDSLFDRLALARALHVQS